MKGKKCPYCGRRISYFTVFHKKKEGLYRCMRCKKESKIKTNFKLMLAFFAVVLLVVLYIIVWQNSDFYNNYLGIIPPVVLLIIFYFLTPLFVWFAPLKKEIEKDNKKKEQVSELSEDSYGGDYVFNREVFDRAKQQRNQNAAVREENIPEAVPEEPFVPIIKDVSEAHASSDAPLKKVSHPVQERYIPEPVTESYEEDVKTYIPHKEKPDGSKYTANRMF